jgi:hypothetical protein
MSGAVFDAGAVALRRREMFPPPPSPPAEAVPDLSRIAHRHCGICPLPSHLICHLTCAAERASLTATDGIRVY